MWRPRPPSVLSKEKIKEIKKNIKKYSAKFESEDRLRLTRASKEQKEKRRGLMKEFEEYRSKRIAQYNEQKPRRLELRKSKSKIINFFKIIFLFEKILTIHLYKYH